MEENVDQITLDYLSAVGFEIIIMKNSWYCIYRKLVVRGGGHRADSDPTTFLNLAVDTALEHLEMQARYG